MRMNDGITEDKAGTYGYGFDKKTFPEIADWIEQNVELY